MDQKQMRLNRNQNIHSMLNMAWNMGEWMASQKNPIDILWLYTGFINNSIKFNIVEYILKQFGLL